MKELKQALAKNIFDFLETYAKIKADYDPEFEDPEDRFNGPDPSEMECAAKLLEKGETPNIPNSSWRSGCYKLDLPSYEIKGEDIHNHLKEEIILFVRRDEKGWKKENVVENPSHEVFVKFEYRGYLVQHVNMPEFGVLSWMFEPLVKQTGQEREWRVGELAVLNAIDEYESE